MFSLNNRVGRNRACTCIFLLVFISISQTLSAGKLRLPRMHSGNTVLQRDEPLPVRCFTGNSVYNNGMTLMLDMRT